VARTLWSWDLATPEVRMGVLEARSGSLRKLLTLSKALLCKQAHHDRHLLMASIVVL
jgi:hypothetical protein